MKPAPDLRLASIDSLEDVEKALASIHANRDARLTVAASTLNKRRGALRDAAFLQTILTWSRLGGEASMNVVGGSEQSTEEILDEACGYSTGIAALAMSGAVRIANESMPRGEALSRAKGRMDAAFQGDYAALLRGRTIDLMCVSGADRQYLKPLFSRPAADSVKDRFALRSTIRAMAMRVAPSSADLNESLISALATLTHELFENTQEHAVTDELGQSYRRHVELVNAGWLSTSDDDASTDFFSSESLREYWKSLTLRTFDRAKVSGFCFNFLDSGPGMAARIRGKRVFELSPEDEALAVRECLQMHVTSKSTHASGGGLQDVLSEVADSRGFIRIRSGRQAIFKCFSPDEIADTAAPFENWFGEARELQRVAGTLVSVFIPLPRPQA